MNDDRRQRFMQDDAPDVSFEESRVAIFPVPYEATVSYGRGTSRGPAAILDASRELEAFNERMGFVPGDLGLWTEPPLVIPDGTPAEVVGRIGDRFGELVDAGKWVVMLGGEHSITPGGVHAVAERYPDLHVVQLDAHADLRESYEGEPHSHACAMSRCLDVAAVAAVHAVGIRSYSAGEAERIRRGIPGYRLTHAREIGGAGWIDRVLEGLDGKSVYLTFDVDYFDPAIVPATGTPEPGGGSWWPTLDLLDRLFSRADVVACDVVELAPIAGLHHADFTVARLVYELIGLRLRGSDR